MTDCLCGCGQDAGVYAKTQTRQGQVKGQARRFIQGHNRRAPKDPLEKTCSRCGEVKPITSFYRRAARAHESRDTWTSHCKECDRQRYRSRGEQARNRYASKQWERLFVRRAKRFGIESPLVETFTRDDVVGKYGDACHYCGGEFQELDHYVPVSKGGPHTLANVRPSCVKCNRSKHDGPPTQPRHSKETR